MSFEGWLERVERGAYGSSLVFFSSSQFKHG
jgi:hypothetical protein